MTRRPFSPRELDTEPVELDPVARELADYAELTAGEHAPDLGDRVMATVADEPTPRRSLLAMLFGSSGPGGGPRLLLVGATMVLGVLAVVLAGRLAGLLPDDQIGPSPSPSIIQLPSVSPTPSLTPSPTPTEEPTRSPRPSRTPRPSPSETETPRATSSGEDETPEPSEDNSGPGGGGGGGDDNSGPGGGGGGGDDSSGSG